MTRSGVRWLILVIVVGIVAGQPGPAAGDDSAAVRKAKALIEVEGKRIWRFAHITVKKYTDVVCDGVVKTDTGFKLSYTFTWQAKVKGKEVGQTTKLAFYFNADGTLDALKKGKGRGIEVVSESSKIDPFDGADLAVVPLRVYMKKQIAILPKTIKAVIEEEIDDKVKASRFLELWLMFREYAAAPKEDKEDK
jgi:hypothetical protein